MLAFWAVNISWDCDDAQLVICLESIFFGGMHSVQYVHTAPESCAMDPPDDSTWFAP